MRKVLWPSRKEMITYTMVVMIFVVIMVTIVALLDFGLAKAVLAVFGWPARRPGCPAGAGTSTSDRPALRDSKEESL